MDYEILARKWRPKSFNDVLGQEHVIKAIINSIKLNKLHHTYLLSGTRGIGKTTIARLLSKALNCEKGITITPCEICSNCNEINKGFFLDFIEIDAASRTRIEDIKDILDNIEYTSKKGRYKIYLIDEIHMLSKHSFNALLKTLEEPPKHVKFILATTDPNKIPETVISRCLHFHLKSFNSTEIYKYLKKILKIEKIKIETEAIKLLAKTAKGSIRDALNLADQAIAINNKEINIQTIKSMLGLLNKEQPLILIEIIIKENSKKLITQLNYYANLGINWENLIIEMLSLLHYIILNQIIPNNNDDNKNNNFKERLKILSLNISPQKLHFFYKILIKSNREIIYINNHKMAIEMILLRIITLFKKKKNNNFKTNKNNLIIKNQENKIKILNNNNIMKEKCDTQFKIKTNNIKTKKIINKNQETNLNKNIYYKIINTDITNKLIKIREIILKKLKKYKKIK